MNKAPRPWQKQTPKQEELPPWAVREPKSPPQEVEQQQSPPVQRWPQAAKSPPLQQQPQQNRWAQPSEIQNNQQIRSPPVQQQQAPPQNRWAPQSPAVRQQHSPGGANVVMITQPQVFQHPGGSAQPQPKQKQPPQQQPGVRIIPIKIESNQGGNNSPTSPVTPGARFVYLFYFHLHLHSIVGLLIANKAGVTIQPNQTLSG